MALTKEQIKLLLALPPKTRGGRKPKNFVDTSVRDSQTWFKLAHKLYDSEQPDVPPKCANPDCSDPRPETVRQLVASVGGVDMCRYCFLEGWQSVNPEQTTLDE
jgi:hypothetical protein